MRSSSEPRRSSPLTASRFTSFCRAWRARLRIICKNESIPPLVDPVRAGRRSLGSGRKAGFDEAGRGGRARAEQDGRDYLGGAGRRVESWPITPPPPQLKISATIAQHPTKKTDWRRTMRAIGLVLLSIA